MYEHHFKGDQFYNLHLERTKKRAGLTNNVKSKILEGEMKKEQKYNYM